MYLHSSTLLGLNIFSRLHPRWPWQRLKWPLTTLAILVCLKSPLNDDAGKVSRTKQLWSGLFLTSNSLYVRSTSDVPAPPEWHRGKNLQLRQQRVSGTSSESFHKKIFHFNGGKILFLFSGVTTVRSFHGARQNGLENFAAVKRASDFVKRSELKWNRIEPADTDRLQLTADSETVMCWS